jgi:preprotein translocase subunit SecB
MTTESKKQNSYFALERIYIKDASFESPKSPEVFKKQWNPEVKVDLSNTSRKLGDNLYEAVLSITVTVVESKKEEQQEEDKSSTIFVTEIQQAGIFKIEGVNDAKILDHTLSVFCLNILFPYAREAIDNMVTRGNFPPLMIAPINFDSLYQSKKQAADKES